MRFSALLCVVLMYGTLVLAQSTTKRSWITAAPIATSRHALYLYRAARPESSSSPAVLIDNQIIQKIASVLYPNPIYLNTLR
jgi:hypothetical protein